MRDAARDGHAGNRGEFTALAHPPQYGRMALRRPCGAGTLQEGEARFVNEDDLRRPAASLFLTTSKHPAKKERSSTDGIKGLDAGVCEAASVLNACMQAVLETPKDPESLAGCLVVD